MLVLVKKALRKVGFILVFFLSLALNEILPVS